MRWSSMEPVTYPPPCKYKITFSERVLEEKGIKQTWLAEQLGKSYNMVNGYVQNRQQPRIEVLYEIAEILGVSVKELLIDKEIKKDK